MRNEVSYLTLHIYHLVTEWALMNRSNSLTYFGSQCFPHFINLIDIFSFKLLIDLWLHIKKQFKATTAQKDGTAASLWMEKRHHGYCTCLWLVEKNFAFYATVRFFNTRNLKSSQCLLIVLLYQAVVYSSSTVSNTWNSWILKVKTPRFFESLGTTKPAP